MAIASTSEDRAECGTDPRGRVRLWAVLIAIAIVLALDPVTDHIARKLPSIRQPKAAAYYVRHLLLHPPVQHGVGDQKVFLIGSSLVRNNIDEQMLARRLTSPSRRVSVYNMGVESAYVLSTAIMARQLRSLKPDLLVWGIHADTFEPDTAVGAEQQHPWEGPLALEFGCSALYGAFPRLAGRERAISQQVLLASWRLFRYRLYFRQYLMSERKARRVGRDAVYGPYVSRSMPDLPFLRVAALARASRRGVAERAAEPLPSPERLAADLHGVREVAASGGTRLVVAWLPGALDAEHTPPAFTLVRRECARAAIPFIDLRGTVPVTAFNDTVHANTSGKGLTTAALLPHLSRALGKGLQDRHESTPGHRQVPGVRP